MTLCEIVPVQQAKPAAADGVDSRHNDAENER